jgi:hypothetical protein
MTIIAAQVDSEREEKIKQRGNILKQDYLIYKLINDESVSIERILAEVKKMEDITKDNDLLYLEFMKIVVGQLQNRSDNEIVTVKAKEIIANAVFMTLKNENFSFVEQSDVLFNQFCIALTFQFRLHKTATLTDCDPESRQKNASRLLELYQLQISQIDENYNPKASENFFIMNGFIPPASYKGPYDSGQDMSNVDDKATREAYKKYKEDETAKLNKRFVQRKAREVRDHYAKNVQENLVDAYSLFPYRTAELERMLTEKKVDLEMSRAILDAVRKVEKENPDKGFRIWLSNDKMFKTEAKLISSNKDSVTIENKNGKQSTIELSALRKEDQDFVKRQLEPEKKTIDDEKVKKD